MATIAKRAGIAPRTIYRLRHASRISRITEQRLIAVA
jgi:hypothetical protein